MRNTLFISAIIAVTATVAVVACTTSAAKNEKVTAAVTQDSLIRRGSYLVTTMVCDDCHSPKQMGPHGPELVPGRRLSGYNSANPVPQIDTNQVKKGWILFGPDLTLAVGPWGASFAANLTSDSTGIGAWKEEQFLTAIRHGKLKGLDGNRGILPPMPWENFSKASDEDLKAIFAFLKSTKPVHNIVPAPKAFSELK